MIRGRSSDRSLQAVEGVGMDFTAGAPGTAAGVSEVARGPHIIERDCSKLIKWLVTLVRLLDKADKRSICSSSGCVLARTEKGLEICHGYEKI